MARRTRTRGFTLIELLVAVLVAAILIVIVYTVYIKAANTYRVQNMALEMQAQARFGMDHLRRDISNAGFNGATNTAKDSNLCFKPVPEIRAISITRSEKSATVPNFDKNKNIQPLEFTLFGDYSGSGKVFYTKYVAGTKVHLQAGWKALLTKVEFEDTFQGGDRRYLRVVDKEQYEMLIAITGSSYEFGTIDLKSSVPVRSGGQSCGAGGFGEGLEVNSAHYIRYRLAKDTRSGAPPNKVDLVREEMKNDGITVADKSMLIITEYVVDLAAYDFVFDEDALGDKPIFKFNPGSPTPDDSVVGGAGKLSRTSDVTQDLRFLTLKLTVRTADEDPKTNHIARGSTFGRIHTFDVEPSLEGAARTMSMTSKLMLKTLAVRNVKAGSS